MATGCRESGESSGFFVARKADQVEQTNLRAARRLAYRIVSGQIGASLLAAGLFQFSVGPRAALSALMGGGIGAVASFVMAIVVFRGSDGGTPAELVRGIYLGEFIKLILTVAMFIAVIILVDIAWVPLLIGYGATFVVYWVALLKAMPGLSGHGG